MERERSLINTIESLRGSGRTVRPLPFRVTADVDALVPGEEIVDPGHAIDPDELIQLAPIPLADRYATTFF